MSLDHDVQLALVEAAVDAARAGWAESGAPIGAVIADRGGNVLGRSSNRCLQDHDPTAHAEIAAARAAGTSVDFSRSVLATTLTPCWMCAGMVDQLAIPTVVVGDVQSWATDALDWLRSRGVEVLVAEHPGVTELLAGWVAEHPGLWRFPA